MKSSHREKTPTILQMDNAECGAVVLAIMLAYFGHFAPISEVREACGVSRDGSKAINIIKAARQYGLDAHGMQITLDEVKALPPPFIVYWQFNHFLIVEGFEGDQVYLNDPATGHRKISMEGFSQGFTGVVLFMNPNADFQLGGKPEPSILQLMWQYMTGMRWSFFYVITVGIAQIFPVIGLAFFAKIFLDNILLGGQSDWLPYLLFSMAGAAILMALLTWLRRYYLLRLYMQLKTLSITRFFWRILHLPLRFFQQRAIGDIVQRVESHSPLTDVLTNKITHNMVGLLSMILLALTLFLINGLLAFITIVIALLNFLLLWFISRRNADCGRRFIQAEGKLSSIEMNGIQIIETLKANAVENQFFNQWAASHAQKLASEQRLVKYAEILKVLPIFSQGLSTVVLLALGCWFIMHNQMTAGGLIAMQILLTSFSYFLLELLEISDYFAKLRGDIARIADVNAQPTENILSDCESKREFPQSPPILEFRNVEFGYSKLEPPILNDVSFKVQAGERIAIVGPTGGGKSSIAKLICGLFAPWAGEVLIHGLPLAKISRADLAEIVGLVDQHIFLFAASVRDNLTLWNSRIPDEDIIQALKIANMAEVIRERGGLNCPVEEYGKNFSGGQVQRLEMARALIGNPHLLILDEATSALDPIVEQQIYANLQRHHCTLIIIAHRLSAIRDCDQIIVINEGKIVQKGRHELLMEDSGLYKELVSLEIQ